jgi:hypothetical protein
LLNGDRRVIQCGGHGGYLALAERTPPKPQSQRKFEVFHGPHDLRGRSTASGNAGRLHAGEQGLDRRPIGGQERPARFGNLVQLPGAFAGTDSDIPEFFEQRQPPAPRSL